MLSFAFRQCQRDFFNIGYAHLFANSVSLDETGSTGRLRGEYNSGINAASMWRQCGVNIVGVQAVWGF